MHVNHHIFLMEKRYDEFCEPWRTGAHLAESTTKDTGHVRTTVFQARIAKRRLSPLATVRSLGLFSTIGEGRISQMAEVECLDLYTRWRRQRL